MQRLESDSLIVRRALRPAPRQAADPFARQRAYGSLMGLALVAVLLVGDLRPAGLLDRRRPCDARVPEDRGLRAAPVPPGLRAAAFNHRRDPGICLQCGSGRRAGALVANGVQEAGRANGTRLGERLAAGKVGRALGTRRDGGGAISAGLSGAPALGDAGRPQQRLGRDAPVSGG